MIWPSSKRDRHEGYTWFAHLLSGPVVLRIGELGGTVSKATQVWVIRGLALEERIYLDVWVGQYVRQVVDIRTATEADDASLDGGTRSHGLVTLDVLTLLVMIFVQTLYLANENDSTLTDS